jgi:heterodisulfide reductase subunit C
MDRSNRTEYKTPEKNRRRQLFDEQGNYFLKKIESENPANIPACYQCERCTNACPVSAFMDIKPHEVIRYIQLGWRGELMESSTIWMCLSCEMCTTYCPNEVAVAETINHLRNIAAREKAAPKEYRLAEFHHTFLKELQRFGRVNEFWLMAALNRKPEILKYKMLTGDLKDELVLGLTLWRKGRLKLLPHRCRAMREIRALYRADRGEVP